MVAFTPDQQDSRREVAELCENIFAAGFQGTPLVRDYGAFRSMKLHRRFRGGSGEGKGEAGFHGGGLCGEEFRQKATTERKVWWSPALPSVSPLRFGSGGIAMHGGLG